MFWDGRFMIQVAALAADLGISVWVYLDMAQGPEFKIKTLAVENNLQTIYNPTPFPVHGSIYSVKPTDVLVAPKHESTA